MSSFSTKHEKPTTDEYLKADLAEVLDRLNRNPASLESEGPFISAVITVRNAVITEKLNKWLVRLTAVVAIATMMLVVVPFVSPSLEAKKLESRIVDIQAAYENLQLENSALKNEVLELKQGVSKLDSQVQNITLHSSGIAKKHVAHYFHVMYKRKPQ